MSGHQHVYLWVPNGRGYLIQRCPCGDRTGARLPLAKTPR